MLATRPKMPVKYTAEFVAVIARTEALTLGAHEPTSVPAGMSNAATRLRVEPFTAVKSPPMYSRLPSGDAAMERT